MLLADRKLDFFIIGAQKAGTTSLYDYLSQHRDIFLPSSKDFFAFNDDPHYGVSESKLPEYFRNYAGEVVIGGSNVQVLPFENAIRNLRDYRPDIKIVIMLRNPIDRAYSAYWMMRRAGLEPCETFEAALQLDTERAHNHDFRTRAELRYLHHGFYDEQLANVFRYFEPAQVHIALFDDLATNPQETTDRVLSSLGLTSCNSEIDFDFRSNESSMPRSPMLESLIRGRGAWKRLYHKAVPLRFRILVNDRVMSGIERKLLQPYRYPKLAADTRERLVEIYRPHLDRLGALLGRDLSSWQRLD